jgi:two-component system LytT family sensor kinase
LVRVPRTKADGAESSKNLFLPSSRQNFLAGKAVRKQKYKMQFTATFPVNKTRKRLLYALYWLGYLLFFTFIQGFAEKDFARVCGNELAGLLPKIIFVAVVVEWLMDSLLYKKRKAAFVFIYVLMLLLFAFFQRLIDNYIILRYFLTDWIKEPLLSAPPFLYNVIKLQFIVTIPVVMKLFYYFSREQNRVSIIRSEKIEAELQSLRNQFHPHFIFNTLNSLYGKILDRSDDAADMVLNISALLRYTVYDINDKKVALEKEIGYLQNYISLQEARFTNRLQLSFSVTGEISNKFIEPFLLLPFIENSFKYCMNDSDSGGWITIFVSVSETQLVMKLENSLAPAATGKIRMEEDANHKGVGLVNVKRRLELLYPDYHQLKITAGADSFFVLLKIKLHDEAG